MGHDIESDLIVGSSLGDLGLITRGKYINVKPGAHSKMINCIRVSDCIPEKTIIISTGEDEYIRFWDTAFNLLHETNIRRTGYFNDISQVATRLCRSISLLFSPKA